MYNYLVNLLSQTKNMFHKTVISIPKFCFKISNVLFPTIYVIVKGFWNKMMFYIIDGSDVDSIDTESDSVYVNEYVRSINERENDNYSSVDDHDDDERYCYSEDEYGENESSCYDSETGEDEYGENESMW